MVNEFDSFSLAPFAEPVLCGYLNHETQKKICKRARTRTLTLSARVHTQDVNNWAR